MQICQFQKTTLLDYPDHLAAIIFLSGCNFRCPFCHNRDLVLGTNLISQDETEIFAYLKKRQGILEGLCITGGEPTLHPSLLEFMKKVKDLGYLIKLDTNGSNPDFIENAFSNKLLDYVAMDIKSGRETYAKVCGLQSIDLAPIFASVSFLKGNSFNHEFRTTIVKEFHDERTFEDIALWLEGDSNYFLQHFVDAATTLSTGLHPCSIDEMMSFRQILLPKVQNTQLRGIDK